MDDAHRFGRRGTISYNRPVPMITLMSDFGTRDAYVAAMIGVVLQSASLLQRDIRPEEMRVVESLRLTLPYVSSTFDGGEFTVPVAAHLATGTSLQAVGSATDRAEVLQLPEFTSDAEYKLAGQLLHTDPFSHRITNTAKSDLALTFEHRVDVDVRLDGTSVGPIRKAYQEVAHREPLALISSSEMVEIAVHGGSAAERFRPGATYPSQIG